MDHDLLFGCQRSGRRPPARAGMSGVGLGASPFFHHCGPWAAGSAYCQSGPAIPSALACTGWTLSRRLTSCLLQPRARSRRDSGTGTRTPFCGFRDRRPTRWTIPDEHLLPMRPEGLEPSPAWLRARDAATNTSNAFPPEGVEPSPPRLKAEYASSYATEEHG